MTTMQIPKRLFTVLLIAFALPLSASAQAPTSAASCLFDTYVARGMRAAAPGSQIMRLQQFLATKFNIVPADVVTGYFGPTTERLVKDYQKGQGLEQTGALGPRTRAAIAKECSSASVASSPQPQSKTQTATSSCPAAPMPSCEQGTLAYQGKDARGCSLGFQCLSFRFPATTTPLVYLPNDLYAAPNEFIATSSVIFSAFPTGAAGDKGYFVMGEPSSVYLELDSAKQLCLRIISVLDGNKSICNPVSLHRTYYIELFAFARSVSLVLNDIQTASSTVRHDAPLSAFRAGSKAFDAKGFMGPLLGSLQRVSLVATSTGPGPAR